ncbi:acetate--CoA ligase [Fontimonas sp. SYSU GA230001]|uniref:acetate--CoA ligase n=1 Tax=Fontimonas sp. SYSU GA230001 TaxID=3142450 RepID=UPI0032B3B17F
MGWDAIRKTQHASAPAPLLADYEAARRTFRWADARAMLDGLPGGSLNIAHEAVDRHAAGARAHKTALRFLGRDHAPRDISYAQLRELTDRFANVLRTLGVERGVRVFVLSERIPELYVAALGTLKAGCVFSPLFSAFGPEPIKARMNLGEGAVLVTTSALYRRKVLPVRAELPTLRYVLLAEDGSDPADLLLQPGIHRLAPLLDAAAPAFAIAATAPEDMALLHFTSGTTGKPKGVVHVHEAVVAHSASARYALDLHDDDVFWCTADPGWVTGTSYGIIAPLVLGVTMIVDREEFDAQRWYRILQDEKVTVWYTAPTAIRMLMKVGADAAQGCDLSRLRHLCSVGEPLNPDAVVWGQTMFGIPFHDNWWQTETGAIMIANYPSMDVLPGSMGKPLPGIDAGIVRHREDGHVEEVTTPDTDGELALRPGWPSMFRAYLHNEERYRQCFVDGWYLSGDLARRDADGYYWFVGRADDVIKSAGHLIGPFEVESTLMEHPAVAGAGVIGKPDPVIGETVKAFVELRQGHEPDETTRRALLGFVRTRLGPAVAPKEIAFVEHLPRTRSGKIMRRLLKARELGLPEGDTSTLESGA